MAWHRLVFIGMVDYERARGARVHIVDQQDPWARRVVTGLARFRELEAEDAQTGRNGTEVRVQTLYRVQSYPFPFLENTNAADEIGELAFLASAMRGLATMARSRLYAAGEVIVKHEVKVKVATDPDRAYRHYLRYNHNAPDKDPRSYGIDTVGWRSRDAGGEGWFSFPSALKCSGHQPVGDGCAFRELGRVKTIHTRCLLHTVDDGIQGSGQVFEDLLVNFSPSELGNDEGSTSDLVVKLFRKGFVECPDVGTWIELLPYTESLRRCCCFNDANRALTPSWVQDGICLEDVGEHQIFAGMWSTARSADLSRLPERCAVGQALYKLEINRGRCLIPHKTNTSFSIHSAGEAEQNIKQVYPSLVPTQLNMFFPRLWHNNQGYVCPAEIGMHHHGCDCDWAHDQC